MQPHFSSALVRFEVLWRKTTEREIRCPALPGRWNDEIQRCSVGNFAVCMADRYVPASGLDIHSTEL